MAKKELFGSVFESSLRILLLLDVLNDIPLNESQITSIDFIAIYGNDYGISDENLHGYGIFRHSEFSAKSRSISLALKKLVLESSVDFISNNNGYSYSISPQGKRIADAINDRYSNEYRNAIKSIMSEYPNLNFIELHSTILYNSIDSLED